MEEEVKHVCKFCYKRFPCGRSLGGHMRSHLISIPSESNETQSKKRLPPCKIDKRDHDSAKQAQINAYRLRENRKKTSKFFAANSSDQDASSLDHDKACKECGKCFPSWKALFGHMKCHSDKLASNYSAASNLEDHDSCQSDTEAAAPIRKQRSRTIKRCKSAAGRNTNIAAPLTAANSSSCVSEVHDQEQQEEVAMSLIMLSRDVGQWDGPKSAAGGGGESSDYNSEFLEAPSMNRIKQDSKTEILKNKMKQTESSKASGISRKELSLKNSEVSGDAFLGDDFTKETDKGTELPKNQSASESTKKQNSSKRKCIALHDDPEMSTDYSIMKLAYGISDSELLYQSSDRKSRFECTTCNKAFHSYQALGGHRASHKRMKLGCLGLKIDSSENSTETEISPNQTADSKLIMNKSYSNDIDHNDNTTDIGSKQNVEMPDFRSKDIRLGHECPICFKLFPSGQALGGHKRAHLVAEAKGNHQQSNQSIVIQKQIPEIRDFLDLNLPAPVEEESNANNDQVFFSPWWMARNHKPEAIVGML